MNLKIIFFCSLFFVLIHLITSLHNTILRPTNEKQFEKKQAIVINGVTDYIACGDAIEALCQRMSKLTLEDNTTNCHEKNIKVLFKVKSLNGSFENSDGFLKQIGEERYSFISKEQTENKFCQIIKR